MSKYKEIKGGSMNEAEEKFPWLKKAVLTDAVIDIKQSFLVWENGTWCGGTWRGGLWEDGLWQDGTWRGGIWQNGTWEDGTWEDGTWQNGTWERGFRSARV